MWILECDGDILQQKKIWLRPGKKYLFGRTNPEGGRYAGFTIAHKSVSRKHLTLSVSAVAAGDGSLLQARSELSIQDENTKIGTVIDGERVNGGRRVLKRDEHSFRLGSHEHLFRIRWQPVVLSFTFPSKDTKGGKDPLVPFRTRLEELDVKTILPYVVGKTTHVVANKRNTAKCLQALINGKYVVENSYIDAIVYATTPSNLDEPESVSLLEQDFDAHWPNPLDHLPPPSKEPGQRNNDFFAPDSTRQNIFDGYSFVFGNLRQYESLQAPITNGAGKAYLVDIEMGITTATEIVRYVKTVAGEKGVGELDDQSIGKGVVVVKFQGEKAFENWAIDIQQEIALTTGQRMIEQNEFLDAILTNDASKLRRPLPVEYVKDTRMFESSDRQRTTDSQNPAEKSSTDTSKNQSFEPATRRIRPRGTVVSAFRGFDDGFDPSQISKQKEVIGVEVHESDSNKVSEGAASDDTMDLAGQANKTRKRPLPLDLYDNDALNDRLLPAAAAMKRRRLLEEKEARARGESTGTVTDETPDSHNLPTSKPKFKQEVNIQKTVFERRKANDEARQRDEESLQQTVSEMTVEEMKAMAIIEEMEIPLRTLNGSGDRAHGQLNLRWDERWNGRKNFKKFRRNGEGALPRRGQTVMVPLEEVKRKSNGISNQYWLESQSSNIRRKARGKESPSQAQTFTTAKTELEEVPSGLVSGDEPVLIEIDTLRTTRSTDKVSQGEQTQDELPSDESKRPAPEESNGTIAKRRRLLVEREDEDSESEDETRFRFRRRK